MSIIYSAYVTYYVNTFIRNHSWNLILFARVPGQWEGPVLWRLW